jgi:hypothetical protein
MTAEYAVAIDVALARLVIDPDYDAGNGPGPCVHTFRDGGVALIGAHWYLDDLRAAMERYGVEEAGEAAVSMGHGLVLIDDRGPLFIEAKPLPPDDGSKA